MVRCVAALESLSMRESRTRDNNIRTARNLLVATGDLLSRKQEEGRHNDLILVNEEGAHYSLQQAVEMSRAWH